MRHPTAILLILAIAMISSCKFLKEKTFLGKKDRLLAEWQARQDSIRVADSIRHVHDSLLAIENARLDSLRLAEEEKHALESRYNIIVGSFITPAYAEALADDYRRRGYDVRIIHRENSRFSLVSAESHESFRRAVSRIQQFQDTVAIDSWIYTLK
ncbi:MAG TPA: hypothetical protein PLO24_05930 [Bacteroidales bacterium]|nr:hypothetical protein [Bacteroidales bacterium]HOS72054.1 hypothetical protein [Bacteroidales bacterium]HQH25323.1 hypothetical protein [Bacteroidales bacterium]HQJ82455.1 hypothetical protein [Bacteroidales bacterium]